MPLLPVLKIPQMRVPLVPADSDQKDSDWKEAYEKVKRRDDIMVKEYDTEIDTLLVFAGLFSAVLTAFIVDVYKTLNIDYTQDSAIVLRSILAHMEGKPGEIALPPTASTSPVVLAVIILWFVSLILSLGSALFGIFIKQWLHTYQKWTEVAQNNFQQGLMLRGFYQTSFKAWKVSVIFSTLGVLLQLALVLFVVGLVTYLWTLNFKIASGLTSAFAFVMLALSALVIVLPIFYEDCPYKSPLIYGVLQLIGRSAARDWTDRDIPIAKRRLHWQMDESQSPLTLAFSQAALLLDIASEDLEAVESNIKLKSIVQERLRELSENTVDLLVQIVTSEALVGDANQLAESDQTRLLNLWKLIFETLPPVPRVLRALHYLKQCITIHVFHDSTTIKCLKLLVELMLPRSVDLASTAVLPENDIALEITRVALAIHKWVNDKPRPGVNTVDVSFTVLYRAATCIPMDGLGPTTRLSPITPYLDFMQAFEQTLVSASNTHSSKPFYTATQLSKKLRSYHNAFLCARTRIYRTTPPSKALRVQIPSSGTHIFVGAVGSEAWVINMSTDTFSAITTPGLPSGMSFSVCSPDGKRVFWASNEGCVYSLQVDSSDLIQFERVGGKETWILAISHDLRYVVTSNVNSLAVHDAETGRTIWTQDSGENADRIYRAAFTGISTSPKKENTVEQPKLATGFPDGTVRIWDVETGSCEATYSNNGEPVHALAWSTGATMLAMSGDYQALVYDTVTHQVKCSFFVGHTAVITNAAFSPNDQLLASASHDHTVRVWNIETQTCVAILTDLNGEVHDVKFSPDGRFIVGAADDGIIIWEINADSVHRTVNSRSR